MANGDTPLREQLNNDVRKPSPSPTVQESTRAPKVDLEQDEEQKEQQKGLTDEEILLKAANEGRVDLGDEDAEKLTDDQIINRASVRQAAYEFQGVLEQRKKEWEEKLKEDDPLSQRIISASNSFYRGLTEFIPAAYKTKAILETALHNAISSEDNQISAEHLPDYNIGKEIGKELEEIFPTNPLYREEFVTGILSKGAGQLTGNVLVSLASGGSSTLAVTGTTLLNATLSSNFYEQAKAEGASEDEAVSHTLVNMAGVSALEALPMAKFVRRMDKATGGGWKQALKNGFAGSIEEGTTEAVQEMYSNASAQTIYDSTRGLMDGVATAFGAGAILGSVANAALPALMKKHTFASNWEERIASGEAIISLAENHFDVLDLIEASDPAQARQQIKEHLESIRKENEVEITEARMTPTGVFSPKIHDSFENRSKFKQLWQRYLATGGRKGKGIMVEEEKMNARVDKQVEKMHLNLTRLNSSILEYYGSKEKSISKAIDKGDVPADISLRLDKKLRGEKVKLPKPIAETAERMRVHVDALSMELMKVAKVQGDLKKSFLKNFGSYIHRSYRLFDPETEWSRKDIPDDVWNSAIGHMRNRLIQQQRDQHQQNQERNEALKAMMRNNVPLEQRQQALPRRERVKKMSEEELRQKAETQLYEILEARNQGSLFKFFEDTEWTTNKGDRDILRKRNKIPKVIREVMGEYKDASVNYMNTVSNMAKLIEKRRYFDTIADRFDGTMFFDNLNDIRKNPDLNSQDYVTGLETGVGSKLNNKYMHKDLLEAMQSKETNQPSWLTMLYRVNAAAKYSKTVLSHVAHTRNLAGGLGFLGFNGHMFNTAQRDAAWKKATTVFKKYQSLTEQELEEQWLKYVELGLTGGSVRAGELKDIFQDAEFGVEDFMSNNFNHLNAKEKGKGAYKQSKSWFKKWSQKATNLYKMEDAFLRTWMFELEKARLQEADPNMTDQEVADLVNDLYPNYGRVNEFIKESRKFPFLAPFISFPAEVVRTSINTVRRAKTEIESDNPALRKIGYQRIGGIATTTLGTTAIGAMSQALLRMSDDEEQSLREFLPPWSRNSTVIYTGRGDGVVRYINTSFTNPYEFLQDPMFALLQGDDDRAVHHRFIDAFSELFAPLTSEEIFTKHVRELISNRTSEGGEVYNPEDPLADKLQKSFIHMWESVEPGSISSFGRVKESLIDNDSKSNVSDELLGLLGLRISSIDIEKSFGFKIRDFRQRIRDSRRVYNSVKFDEDASEQAKEQAFQRSNLRYEDIFEEMKQITEAAQKSGLDWATLQGIMDDSGLASRDIDGLKRGDWEGFKR